MSKLPTLMPQNMTEAMEFSKMVASSNMVPANYKGKPQDVMVAIQWGYELGLQPLQAMQNISVINGKPSVYGDAALALVKNDSRCAGVSETIEGEGDNRKAICKVKRRYGDEIEETIKTFSVQDAKKARLWGKQGPWSSYPDRMLTMRARGFALRDSFPDALKGMITREEAEDYPEDAQIKDITPVSNPLDALEAPPVQPVVEPTPEPEPEPDAPPWDDNGDVLDKEPAYVLYRHDGKVKDEYDTDREYVAAYLDFMDVYQNAQVKQGSGPTYRERMTYIKQLKEANGPTMERLQEAELQKISDKYSVTLRALGANLNRK